jgi:hypothetical protein
MSVAAQRSPAIMQRELLYFDYRISCFKKSASRLMSEIMKTQVLYVEKFAGLTESTPDGPGFKWKYSVVIV